MFININTPFIIQYINLFTKYIYLFVLYIVDFMLTYNFWFFSILSEDNLSQSSFEGIASTFHHTFQRQDHFRVGSSLVSPIFDRVTGILVDIRNELEINYWIALSVLNCSSERSSKDHLLLIDPVLLQEET